ncbi:hypothetical protein [uncultured Roseobacter sp.]|uniref:hypothetical protein n=1 Tax=uncultured Roseobacter sp. TaxID=114847 RepID=UPI002633B9B7|nr:hypothetical protein [uncultured Roseobacter sp.]
MRHLLSALAVVCLAPPLSAAPHAMFSASTGHMAGVGLYSPDEKLVPRSTLFHHAKHVPGGDLPLQLEKAALFSVSTPMALRAPGILSSLRKPGPALSHRWQTVGPVASLAWNPVSTETSDRLRKVPVPASAQMLLVSVAMLGTFNAARRPASRRTLSRIRQARASRIRYRSDRR